VNSDIGCSVIFSRWTSVYFGALAIRGQSSIELARFHMVVKPNLALDFPNINDRAPPVEWL
jgi:hypothetical protein